MSSIDREKNFRNWFSGSVVVTESGDPLVVYHGTPNTFSEFLSGAYSDRSGFYFTDDAVFASRWAEVAACGIAYDAEEDAQGPSVMPVYLSICNPLDLQCGWSEAIASELSDLVSPRWLTGLKPTEFWNALDYQLGRKIVSRLQEMGYDGILASEGSTVWVAFRPEQIKSAIGNSGAYHRSSADICDA